MSSFVAIFSLAIAALTLPSDLAPLPGRASAVHIAESDSAGIVRDASAVAPDSVRLLLFAQGVIRKITVEGGDRRGSRHDISIAPDNGALLIDGSRSDTYKTTAPPGRIIVLRSGSRLRRVSGRLEIVAAEGLLHAVATMPVRDYLAAALAAETVTGDPDEFLTALSVLQHNYLTTHRKRHAPFADLCDNTHCQVASLPERRPAVSAAVDEAMRIGLRAGDAFPCYYSANCGGSTLTPEQVWGRFEPGYGNIVCGHCRQGKWHSWTRSTPATPALEARMGDAPTPPFVNDDFKMSVGRLIGFNIVLSNTVDRIERRDGRYIFHGRGFGHRVGMCAEGAARLARNGREAREILRYYFPDAELSTR